MCWEVVNQTKNTKYRITWFDPLFIFPSKSKETNSILSISRLNEAHYLIHFISSQIGSKSVNVLIPPKVNQLTTANIMHHQIERIVQDEYISVDFSLILFILNSEASQPADHTTTILLRFSSKNHLLDGMTFDARSSNNQIEAWKMNHLYIATSIICLVKVQQRLKKKKCLFSFEILNLDFYCGDFLVEMTITKITIAMQSKRDLKVCVCIYIY